MIVIHLILAIQQDDNNRNSELHNFSLINETRGFVQGAYYAFYPNILCIEKFVLEEKCPGL